MTVEKQSNKSKGGARPGAGRKKGQPNRRTVETQAIAAEGGLMPLEFMLDLMRNGGDERLRFAAAQAAAPYVHAKLAAVEVTGKNGGPVDTVTRIELVAMTGNDDS